MWRFKEYFPHSINAFFDIKIQELFDNFGFEGYGVFWFFLEEMAKKPKRNLLYSEYIYLAKKYNISEEILQHLTRPHSGLFVKKGNYIYSKRLKEHFEKLDKISVSRSLAKRGKVKSSKSDEINTNYRNENDLFQEKMVNSSPHSDALSSYNNALSNANNDNSSTYKNQLLSNDNHLKTIERNKNKNKIKIKEKEIKNKELNDFDFFLKNFKLFFDKLVTANSVIVPESFTYDVKRAYEYYEKNGNISNKEGYIYTIALDAFNKLLEYNYKIKNEVE